MMNKKAKTRGPKKLSGPKKIEKPRVTEKDLDRVEFHRQGLALLPRPGDRSPGVAYWVKGDKHGPDWRFCSCSLSGTRVCSHILELSAFYKFTLKHYQGKDPYEEFRSSLWYRLGVILEENARTACGTIRIQYINHDHDGDRTRQEPSTDNPRRVIRIVDKNGDELLSYFSSGPDLSRLIERLTRIEDKDAAPNRASILEKLSLITLSENERMMLDRGFKTRGMALIESFWYRMTYHCYREFGLKGYSFHPAIEEKTGAFTITCKRADGEPVFRTGIPRHQVHRLLLTLKEFLPNQNNMAIHPIPLKSIFKITMNTEMDLDILPMVRLLQEDGEEHFLNREDLERFRYGNLVFIRELGLMAELEKPGRERRFQAPVRMTLKKSQVPVFLEEFGEELFNDSHLLDEKIKSIRILRSFDRVTISPEAIDRDWCWLDVKYGFGSTHVSLKEILKARENGERFIGTREGWIDCQSPELEAVSGAFPYRPENKGKGLVKLSRLDLLRLKATSLKPIETDGDGQEARRLNDILELKASVSLPPLKLMRSALRQYQKTGVEWLLYLFENGFGGLLCDDMGLGKTHQAMALMLYLKKIKKEEGSILVVSPTTVMSHWQKKIGEHVPDLRASEYHGGQRDLAGLIDQSDIILTSYGILRNDVEELKEQDFSLIIFDEIQYIKNSQTKTYQAAREIPARMKVGLTGTPVENTLMDLKTLMDLAVPGYLGGDEHFYRRYIQEIDPLYEEERRRELVRLISPFTLRRLKQTVLSELPPKIEDIRFCRLSEDQVKLYREAVSARGYVLLDILKKNREPVPYIHVFALLNLLKQICDHPSLLDGGEEGYEQYESGKWELFKEIMEECLASGQKVVVYSQYLKMIAVMEQYFRKKGLDFATLTGTTRNRGEIIDRFNNDPDCRIYIGSLKAGGTGIDLVGGSVVIHYDRWWNAAREDQATDRVHRIGQKRGVHIFKLVTEGTLEEKISALIAKKKNLMESVIKEDDPAILKTFSRKDLIDLLSSPIDFN